MKILFTLVCLVAFTTTVGAQSYNPFANSPDINPAPLNLPANGAMGQISFNFGLTTSDNAPLMVGDELTITVTLQLLEPLTTDPLDAIAGTYASFFDWQYNASSNSYLGTQNQELPGSAGGSIIVNIAVTGESMDTNPQNGFNVNIQPAGYMVATNSMNDDNVSASTFTDPGAPLPVELTSFDGTAQDCNVQLEWRTATELNNAHFEVQWSTNGKQFKVLEKVEGTGTTLEPQAYSFLHENAAQANYYRLKQVDFDGAFEYSNTIRVETSCKEEVTLSVYPNLTRDGLVNLALQGEVDGTAHIEILDVYGKVVHRQQTTIPGGSFSEVIDVTTLGAGKYFIRISGENWTSAVKSIVKTK